MNRPSIMNWPGGSDSCTCSSTLIGRPAQTPTAARRGSASKSPMMEVPDTLILPISFIFIFFIFIYLACFTGRFLLLFLFLFYFFHSSDLSFLIQSSHVSVILFHSAVLASGFSEGFILQMKCYISSWLTVYGTVSLCVPFYNIFASFKGCLLAVACFKFFSSSSTYFDFDFSTVEYLQHVHFIVYIWSIFCWYIRLFLFCYETFSCGGWLAYLIKVIFYFRLIFYF